MEEDFVAINEMIRAGAKKAAAQMEAEQDALGILHRDPAGKKITVAIKKNAGLVARISFRFERQLIYSEKGVGRGTKISQVGNTSRKPKPWFNKAAQRFADEITEAAADMSIDIIFDKLKIK